MNGKAIKEALYNFFVEPIVNDARLARLAFKNRDGIWFGQLILLMVIYAVVDVVVIGCCIVGIIYII